jgi:hypothetical protein
LRYKINFLKLFHEATVPAAFPIDESLSIAFPTAAHANHSVAPNHTAHPTHQIYHQRETHKTHPATQPIRAHVSESLALTHSGWRQSANFT